MTKSTWPLEESFLIDAKVVYKMCRTYGLRNHTETSLKVHDAVESPCMCSTVDDRFKVGGHVLTQNVEVLGVTDDTIPKLMKKGSNHRGEMNRLQAFGTMQHELYEFAYACKAKSQRTVPVDRLDEWVASTLSLVMKELPEVESSVPHHKLKSSLTSLHSNFCLAPCDKNPQSTIIWCKKRYGEVVLESLAEPVFVVYTDETAQAIVDRHAVLARSYGHMATKCLPYAYALAKLHKLDTHRNPYRIIVGKSAQNTPDGVPADRASHSLSTLRKHVGQMLNSIIDLLVMKDRSATVKRVWICRTSQEYVDAVAAMPNGRRMTTMDFTTMYTQLDHETVIREVGNSIDDAASELLRRFPCVSLDAIAYSTNGTWNTEGKGWNLKKLKSAVEASVRNAFVKLGNTVWCQKIGIGMGLEDSPPIANLVLYRAEKLFVDHLVAHCNADTLREKYCNFAYHRRYIDDIFAPTSADDLPSMEQYFGMKLAVTHEGHKVVFLGVETESREGLSTLCRCLDKQKSFKFTITRYPSWDTNVPRHVKIGTIVGCLGRVYELTSLVKDFVEEARYVLSNFTERGYTPAALEAGVRKFANRYIVSQARKDIIVQLTTKGNEAPPQVGLASARTSVPSIRIKLVATTTTDPVASPPREQVVPVPQPSLRIKLPVKVVPQSVPLDLEPGAGDPFVQDSATTVQIIHHHHHHQPHGLYNSVRLALGKKKRLSAATSALQQARARNSLIEQLAAHHERLCDAIIANQGVSREPLAISNVSAEQLAKQLVESLGYFSTSFELRSTELTRDHLHSLQTMCDDNRNAFIRIHERMQPVEGYFEGELRRILTAIEMGFTAIANNTVARDDELNRTLLFLQDRVSREQLCIERLSETMSDNTEMLVRLQTFVDAPQRNLELDYELFHARMDPFVARLMHQTVSHISEMFGSSIGDAIQRFEVLVRNNSFAPNLRIEDILGNQQQHMLDYVKGMQSADSERFQHFLSTLRAYAASQEGALGTFSVTFAESVSNLERITGRAIEELSSVAGSMSRLSTSGAAINSDTAPRAAPTPTADVDVTALRAPTVITISSSPSTSPASRSRPPDGRPSVPPARPSASAVPTTARLSASPDPVEPQQGQRPRRPRLDNSTSMTVATRSDRPTPASDHALSQPVNAPLSKEEQSPDSKIHRDQSSSPLAARRLFATTTTSSTTFSSVSPNTPFSSISSIPAATPSP